ncbi:intraflagellar transport protein 22 homolog [Microplitis demolitor]|uniref:intraflagellar transport protein 22 homolog n=1 Tax=Microplitis demolitor TaxID=69319 RepID=UPI0006D51B2C|nr:intraflagellar transport protein 22 homolog [Microplitis demolitor]
MKPVKIVIIGPVASGKTMIANFLADATGMAYDYRPTQGVRILEFDVLDVDVKNKKVKVDIELWDCSGDDKFEDCWSAIKKDIQGLIFVYNKKTDEQVQELEKFYNYFVLKSQLEPKDCVVFFFESDKQAGDAPKRLSNVFAKISQVNCSLEENRNKLKTDFQTFLSTLMTRIQEKVDQEENNILKDN